MKKIGNKIIVPFIFILFFILEFSLNLQKHITNLDELWNYNTARCILNGLIPYKDISMITTPLFPFINAVILKITTDELIVFRIISSLLQTLILYITYRIFYLLTKKRVLSLILTSIFVIIYYEKFTLDYNYFCLFLFLIIELIQLKIYNKEKDDYKEYIGKISLNTNTIQDFIIGLLAGCAICTKHTVGTFIAIYAVLMEINQIIKYRADKKERIEHIKKTIWRIIGIMIPVLILVLYLAINSALVDFINYAIIGIKSFSNSISYKLLLEKENKYVAISSVVAPLYLLVMLAYMLIFRKKRNKNEDINVNTLVISSLPLWIIVYPISDENHFLIASYCTLICFIFVVTILLSKIYTKVKLKSKDFIIITLECFWILLCLAESCTTIKANWKTYKNDLLNGTTFNEYKEKIKNGKTLKHYSYLNINEYYIEINNKLKEFIEEKESQGYKVYLCDAEAALYDIPLDIYNKNFDMFLKGNIGKDGEEGVIEGIKNSEKSIYLIKQKQLRLNWQTPTDVIDYIRYNLKYKGDIEFFEIYEK